MRAHDRGRAPTSAAAQAHVRYFFRRKNPQEEVVTMAGMRSARMASGLRDSRRWPLVWAALAAVAALAAGCTGGPAAGPPSSGPARVPASSGSGLVPTGEWSSLPSGTTCKGLIGHSAWEPRPGNFEPNHVMPNPAAVHAALADRSRATGGANPRWDSWLLPRVDGQFTGTTDEIFQWAACKWGLPADMIRAVAYRESQWFQYATYSSGRCLPDYGCTDLFSSATPDSKIYCSSLAAYGYNYQKDFGSGICPKTFSIVSVMSWQDPSWGPIWPGYQNGTFPFNRESTAFAVDYYGAYLRGCYEGWSYLGTKTAGDIDGCIGSWYSGAWHDPAGNAYDQRVREAMRTRPWLSPAFATQGPACNARYGCPVFAVER